MTSEHCTAILAQRYNSCGNRTFWYKYISYLPSCFLFTSVVGNKTICVLVYICCVTSFPPCREVFRRSFGTRNILYFIHVWRNIVFHVGWRFVTTKLLRHPRSSWTAAISRLAHVMLPVSTAQSELGGQRKITRRSSGCS